ncbi:MAG: 5-formyltetrahydrofolate cyclo-ligase [Nitrospinae bacterium]|nr:5-formyltetrahydrofolate cyclo-ligase [Nitrospinota bacterium]
MVFASMKMDKFAVRQDMKRRRDAMILDDVLNLSRAVEDRLFACKDFLVCQNVMFFLSFGNEVRTDEMITRSLKDGKRVYVPRLIMRERRLEVCEITDMNQEFELGSFDIREPSRHNSRVVSPAMIDAVIAPGLAFDRSGGRIGFGGGYFDWLFKQLSDEALRLGVAYAFQVADSIPQDSWDEKVQTIFTDNEAISC